MASTRDDMNKITDNLYLGNAIAPTDTDSLSQHGITHVLTLECQRIEHKEDGKEIFGYKFVNCLDMQGYDLLSHFEECFIFLDDALQKPGNKVLIHCFAGMSRSATILIAYLMYKEDMCLDEAYGTVKEHRPLIKPNNGFLKQLKLFQRMGRSLGYKQTPLYRKYRLKVLAKQAQKGNFDELRAEDLHTIDGVNSMDNCYKCMKCRRVLFRSSSMMTHSVGQGEAAFDWRGKIPANQKPADCDTSDKAEVDCDKSIFIEPVKWMAESIRQLEGKLNCPKCNSKLGSFIWYGEKCSCGAWVAPAFHIQQSKVDLFKRRPVPTIGQSNPSQVTTDSQSNASQVTTGSQSNPSHMTLMTSVDQSANTATADGSAIAAVMEQFSKSCDVGLDQSKSTCVS